MSTFSSYAGIPPAGSRAASSALGWESTSGAMKPAVPTRDTGRSRAALTARPKSPSTTRPASSRKMFSGLGGRGCAGCGGRGEVFLVGRWGFW
jgi:hypothetical protein